MGKFGEKGGREFKPQKYVENYSKKNVYRKRHADPDNERPDKWWSSRIFSYIDISYAHTLTIRLVHFRG
jgi:hypothetical protein